MPRPRDIHGRMSAAEATDGRERPPLGSLRAPSKDGQVPRSAGMRESGVQIGFPAPHMDVQVSRAVQGRTNVAERMDARERLGQGWPGATRFVERRLSPLGPPAIIRKARI